MELNNTKLKEDTLDKYNQVLNKNEKWGNGYWDGSIGKEKAKICTKYLCEDILKFDNNDFEYHITKYMFNNNKLGNMLKKVYNDFPDNTVIDAFPEKAEIIVRQQKITDIEKEIKVLVPEMLKSESNRKEVVEKVISFLGCDEKDIPKKLSYFMFSSFNLDDIFKRYYNSSVFKFIEEVRPGVFKPWEFDQTNKKLYEWAYASYSKEVPKDYFNEKTNRYDAVVWIFKKMQVDGKTLKSLSIEMVNDYGLFTLLRYYKNSVFFMIDEFFKGQTTPWQFKEHGSKAYWNNNSDVAKKGILYLINKLSLTNDSIPSLTLKDFEVNYLECMLNANYNGLIFAAIDDVYPNKFEHMKWCFKDIPKKVFYIKENRQDAIYSLVKKMNLSEEDIPYYLTKKILITNGFDYILNDVHKGNLFLVIDEAYPNKYNKEDCGCLTEDVEEYIDLFKGAVYSKLSFSNETDEDIIKGITKLGEIFTINTNSWVGQKKLIPFFEEMSDLEVMIYKELTKGDICLYEFEYEEPKEPKDETERLMFDTLLCHSRAKYLNVIWLYWRSYNFFKQFNFHLQLDTVYMGLGKENYQNRRRYYSNYKHENADYLKDTIEKYKSIVRCGELEVTRLYSEISSGADCVWVFPFDENLYTGDGTESNEYNKKSKAYLLQFNHDSIVALNNLIRGNFESKYSLANLIELHYKSLT